jgi:leucyl aminopeptidase
MKNMNLEFLNRTNADLKSDITIEFVTKKELKSHAYKSLIKKSGFEASQDTLCLLHEKRVLLCGIEELTADDIRSAAATAAKKLKATNYKSAKTIVEEKSLIAPLVEGFVLGGYTFEKYKTATKEQTIKVLSIIYTQKDYKEAIEIFSQAVIVSDATCFTRDIVNTAPDDIYPQKLAKIAKKLAKENGLECKILGKKELKQERCEAMLAVGRASRHESKLIHLAYKPKNAKKSVTLVGKGLTYDSGGLSLKPATSMVSMKMDKAGACAVLGIIKAASELKLNIEVHAFIGAVENMIGGDAYKPDDVLYSRKGDTIEVRNTDAEGRLVLADVLDYAQEKTTPDYLFDFATLTGACMVALGQYTTGVMGHSSKLKHDIGAASRKAGELTATLPFNKHLKKQLKSEIADICNISNKPYGGAITAGLFLDNFIKEENKEKWLHFDIAGSAYTESAWDVNNYGATGAGVRFMTQFLKSIK